MGTLPIVHQPCLKPSNFTTENATFFGFSTQNTAVPTTDSSYFLPITSRRRRIKLKMATAASDAAAGSAHLDQTPGVQQRKIIIQNNCGEKLVGILHEAGSNEIVILCHGFQCTKDVMKDLALAFEKQGISVFRFDFSGNGESEGTFQFGNYRTEVDDLHSVIQHFTGENRDISAILGHSKGGNVVLLYASLHRDVKTVVNLSGRYKMDRGIEERLGKDYLQRVKQDGFIDVKSKTGEVLYRVTEESLMERLNTNMHEACLKIYKDCRVLTVHGSNDEVIPVEDASEFANIVPNHRLRVVEGANHAYTHHLHEVAAAVFPFIKESMAT